MTGVYSIVNTVNGNIYIGSAADIETRWKQHKAALSKNKHINHHLQSAWNKYGSSTFIFEVLEACSAKGLLDVEQKWIDVYYGRGCYNIQRVAMSPIPEKNADDWLSWSEAQRVAKFLKDKQIRIRGVLESLWHIRPSDIASSFGVSQDEVLQAARRR